ncbi:MAG: DUF1624 domain-containing protein [Phycisphaerae bacterium]|nr:DUF1624 domain-containing protein [Phycisphaerae bacterium]
MTSDAITRDQPHEPVGGSALRTDDTAAGDSSRVAFLDLARGLAVVFMILSHAMVVYAVGKGWNTVLGVSVGLLGTSPAAPVFMVVMGVFLGRSQKTSVKRGVTRGLMLLAVGYLLTFARLSVPLWIRTGSWTNEVDSFSPWSGLWMVDILQLAGMSLIVLTVVRHFLPWRAAWLGLCLLVACLSPLLWGCSTFPGSDLLWGTGPGAIFPLFPWVVFPLIGMFLSEPLRRFAETDRPMKHYGKLGLALMILGFVVCVILEHNRFGQRDYPRMGPGSLAIVTGFVLIWLPVCRWLVRRVPPNRFFDMLYCWSRYVTVVYVIQWLLIGWGVLVFGYQRHTALDALVLGIGVLLISHALMKLYMLHGPPGHARRASRQFVPA